MTDQTYAPWPAGYESLTVEHIDGVAYVPDGKNGVILFTSTAGQKVCLVAPLADLNRAVLQIQSDPSQTRLRVIDGGVA